MSPKEIVGEFQVGSGFSGEQKNIDSSRFFEDFEGNYLYKEWNFIYPDNHLGKVHVSNFYKDKIIRRE